MIRSILSKIYSTWISSAILLSALIFCTPIIAVAEDWVDDWIQQSTYSMPNTYDTQKRRYITGGKLSVRYKQDTDHLVNITLPNFKKGCGGIDLFSGSLNYLNADRLVDKFDRIMSGALATYAFDLALNVLCEPCAKELKSLEALIDRINQLQIDDCKATQAVVAYMKNQTGVGDSEENTEAISDFVLSTGAGDFGDYGELTKASNNGDIQNVMNAGNMSKHDLVSACPESMRNIFFTEGTLLGNLAEETGIGADKVEFMRAMIGDVYISEDLEYGAIAPCPQNNPTNIDAIVYGDFYHRRNGACLKDMMNIDGVMYESLYDWARENILTIAQRTANKEPLEDHTDVFINTMPQPILVMIITDIMAQGNGFDAEKTADRYAYTASIVLAHGMMRDLYNDLYKMLHTARIAAFNVQSGAKIRCNRRLKSKVQLYAKDMLESVEKYSRAINTNYTMAMTEAIDNSRYVQFLRESQNVTEEAALRKVAFP